MYAMPQQVLTTARLCNCLTLQMNNCACMSVHTSTLITWYTEKINCGKPQDNTWYTEKINCGKPQHKFHNECNTNIVKHKMYTNNWPAWTRWTAGTSVQASPWVRKMITDHEHWSVSPRIRSKITGITSNKNHNSNHRALKHDYKWNYADRE